MSSIAPPWMRKEWLPRFEFIEWPRLEALRDEHHALIDDYQGTVGLVPTLEARFATEDEQALAKEREAARAGTPSPKAEDAVTSPLRRQAELEAASERHGETRAALHSHIAKIVHESLNCQHEVEEILGEAAAQVQPRPVDDPISGNGELLEDLVEKAKEPDPAQRAIDKAGLDKLVRDRQKIETWYLATIGPDGENVLPHIGREEVAV